jgi:uncharacterized protein
MNSLYVTFPVSGVETSIWTPIIAGFMVSFFSSMVGISGAFLLLPFQMSYLHFTAPSVSATNLVYNLIATPSGVYRYLREGRMMWPLAAIIMVGSLPGIGIGYFIRVRYLSDPQVFKVFAGGVLLYIGYRLLSECTPWKARMRSKLDEKFAVKGGLTSDATVRVLHFSPARVEYDFWGETFSFSTRGMLLLGFMVGIVGGTYGIGGGAIIAPFCVAMFRLPIHTVAGAALAGTLVTSIVGVMLYSVLPSPVGLPTHPDWALGLLFGLGGIAGVYLGAGCQRFVPQKALSLLLGGLLVVLALQYITSFAT